MAVISVIIPCYNAADYIEKCLSSMAAQTFRDFEVIVVDDCSTDDSIAVIQKFQQAMDIPIRLLKNEKNAGPGVSRNLGILEASSEYVCFCDSDDWYEPDFLELMMASSREKTADMVICTAYKIVSCGTSEARTFYEIPFDASAKEVLAMGVDSLCYLMVRRRIALDTPQPPLHNGEDMAVIPLMIMQCKQFGVVRKAIYNYQYRPGSLSVRVHKGIMEALEASFHHIYSHRLLGFDLEIEFVGIKNLVYGGLLNYYKTSDKSGPARELLVRFEEKFPHWYSNPYRKQLPLFKRIFVFFAKKRYFFFLFFMSRIHKWLTERR